MNKRGTTSEKAGTEANTSRTSVPGEKNVSRETYTSPNPSLKELYYSFRKNKLSRIESAYNAAYLYCNDKYYTSGAQLKERYRNIYPHPGTWFRHESSMWKHNKWSAAIKLLELLPIAKRTAEITADATKPIKHSAYSLWRQMEYSHIGISVIGKLLLKISVFALCVIVTAGIILTMHANTRKTPVLEVYIDGKYVGTTDSISTIEQAQKVFEQSESLLLRSTYSFDCDITYKPTSGAFSDIMNPSDINAAFKNATMQRMSQGYGLYIDNTLVCASPYKSWLDSAINDSLENKKKSLEKSGIVLESVTYYNNMSITAGLYPNSSFMNLAEIRKMFSLAPVLNTDLEHMSQYGHKSLHRGIIDEEHHKRDHNINHPNLAATVSNALPIRTLTDESSIADIRSESETDNTVDSTYTTTLDVLVENTVTETESIPYNTVYVQEPSLMEGKTKVSIKGKPGKKSVTYTVGYLDSKEVMRIKLTEEINVLPITETILIGTRPMTEEEKRTMSTGTYIMPTTGHSSSGYGWRVLGGRNEFHKGIDIASARGTKIVASDGGEIIHARSDNSGYGLSIQIRHDDGTVTRYAHCDKVYVIEGQRVAQGETIAAMGDTGYVTGVHLHFELLINGQTQNPYNYIK